MSDNFDDPNSIFAPLLQSLTDTFLKLNDLSYEESIRRFDAVLDENIGKANGDAFVIAVMKRMTQERRFAAAIRFNRPINECVSEMESIGDRCLRDAMIYLSMVIELGRYASKRGSSKDAQQLVAICDGFVESIDELGVQLKQLEA